MPLYLNVYIKETEHFRDYQRLPKGLNKSREGLLTMKILLEVILAVTRE